MFILHRVRYTMQYFFFFFVLTRGFGLFLIEREDLLLVMQFCPCCGRRSQTI